VLAQDVVDEEITAALADAGLASERVIICVHNRDHHHQVKPSGHFRPGQLVDKDDDLDLDQDDVAKLNDAGALDRHRIVVFAGYQPEKEERWVLAGLLRHELEHARQWEELGDAPFLLSRLIDEMHDARFGDALEEKYLYRAKPDEQDANAAATGHLLARCADAPVRLHTEAWYPLVWSYTKPEPLETLIARSVCFLFQYARLCEQKAEENGQTFAEVLAEIDGGAVLLWRALVSQ
jgi:hypothetical protein